MPSYGPSTRAPPGRGGATETMAGEVKHLVQSMDALIEQVERTRSVLQRYKTVSAKVARRVEEAQLLADVLAQVNGPVIRREITEAIEELEGARHRVRLAMFALGEAQGTSISELAHQLGFSRQLGSRLAREAEGLFG